MIKIVGLTYVDADGDEHQCYVESSIDSVHGLSNQLNNINSQLSQLNSIKARITRLENK
ncbi:hypothetical protein [Liquorilactobacillus capillatus]|uniref:hypothetical protein n=1 Tax=Liquorilactobacillus capillatus TaxID=480931 RepID=UPI000A5219F3|nr:hypothetical protein [Liquorilactobacillus capillatus]